MQNLMGAVTSGFAEKLGVKRLDNGIFVTFTKRSLLVCVINGFSTQCANVDIVGDGRRLNWLSSAVYATARTSHYLDELIIALSGFNVLEHFFRVGETARHAYFYDFPVKVYRSDLDSFRSAY